MPARPNRTLHAVALASLALAAGGHTPKAVHAADGNKATDPAPAEETITLPAGSHHELLIEKGVERIAIADEQVASVTITRAGGASPAARLVLSGRTPGSTSLLVWERGNPRAKTYRLDVHRRVAAVDGSHADAAAHRLALDKALSTHAADAAVVDRSTLNVKSHTVQVEVKIVELHKNVLKRAGVNLFSTASNRHGFTFGAATPGSASPIGVSGSTNQFSASSNSRGANGLVQGVVSAASTGAAAPVISSSASASGQLAAASAVSGGAASNSLVSFNMDASPVAQAFNLLGFFNKAGFGMRLGLLEGNGLARVLAEPTLVALSGQSASFLAGGEIPVPVAQGLGTTTIEYKPFGIGLTVSPTVLSDQRIVLKVAPEASDLNYANAVALNGTAVPAITTRRADTTVELGDGESFVIGGLVSRNTRSNIDKVPLLGDIPVLGALFKSLDYQQDESELVIVVTPHLVRPMARGVSIENQLPGARSEQHDAPVWRSFLAGPASDDALPGFSR